MKTLANVTPFSVTSHVTIALVVPVSRVISDSRHHFSTISLVESHSSSARQSEVKESASRLPLSFSVRPKHDFLLFHTDPIFLGLFGPVFQKCVARKYLKVAEAHFWPKFGRTLLSLETHSLSNTRLSTSVAGALSSSRSLSAMRRAKAAGLRRHTRWFLTCLQGDPSRLGWVDFGLDVPPILPSYFA